MTPRAWEFDIEVSVDGKGDKLDGRKVLFYLRAGIQTVEYWHRHVYNDYIGVSDSRRHELGRGHCSQYLQLQTLAPAPYCINAATNIRSSAIRTRTRLG